MNNENAKNDSIQDALEASELVNRVKSELDNSSQELPSHIVSALRRARQQALQTQNKKLFSWFRFPTLIQHPWLASCASVLAIVLVVGYGQLISPPEDTLAEMDQESDILFAEDNLDLYEDLEFYRWLANTGY